MKQGNDYWPSFLAITKSMGDKKFFGLMDKVEAKLKAEGKIKQDLGLDVFTRLLASRIIEDAPTVGPSGRRWAKRLLQNEPALFKRLIAEEIDDWFRRHPKEARQVRCEALKKFFGYPPDETLTKK